MASGPAETTQAAAVPDALSSQPKLSPSVEVSSTRQSRVRRREDAIVAAAREMFTTHGYAKTTMAMIARAAGVADGTLYTYFENKEALARGVIADFYKRLTDSSQAGVDGRRTTRTKLDFLARHHLQRIMDERGIIEMLPTLMSSLSDYEGSDVHSLNKTYVAVFDRTVREGRASGDIPSDADVRVLRDIFYGALDYGGKSLMMRSSRKGARKADMTRFVDRLVSMIVGTGETARSVADRLESVADRLENTLKQIERK